MINGFEEGKISSRFLKNVDILKGG